MFYTKDRFVPNFELFAKSLILYSEYFMRKTEYSLFVTEFFISFIYILTLFSPAIAIAIAMIFFIRYHG